MSKISKMRRFAVALAALAFCIPVAARAASTEADFKSALAAAEAAEKDAGALKNQWTTTEQALAAAKKAAAGNDFDTAVKQAQQAEALAKASIAQAKEQQDAWQAAVIR
jgi:anti-sigma factor ChrR (cupin superfamily)